MTELKRAGKGMTPGDERAYIDYIKDKSREISDRIDRLVGQRQHPARDPDPELFVSVDRTQGVIHGDSLDTSGSPPRRGNGPDPEYSVPVDKRKGIVGGGR